MYKNTFKLIWRQLSFTAKIENIVAFQSKMHYHGAKKNLKTLVALKFKWKYYSYSTTTSHWKYWYTFHDIFRVRKLSYYAKERSWRVLFCVTSKNIIQVWKNNRSWQIFPVGFLNLRDGRGTHLAEDHRTFLLVQEPRGEGNRTKQITPLMTSSTLLTQHMRSSRGMLTLLCSCRTEMTAHRLLI